MRSSARSALRLLPVAALAAAGLQAGPAPAATTVADTGLVSASSTVTHLKTIKQRLGKVTGPEAGPSNQGSDIEFVDLDVTGLAEAPVGVTGVREFALGGSLSQGMQIYDITDPSATALVGVYDCRIYQGDIQVFKRAGRTYVTYTADSATPTTSQCYKDALAMGFSMGNRLGTYIADITNPYAPTTVSFINLSKGSHNQSVHPGGMYMYNSNNELTGGIGKMEVIDIHDLSAPKQVATLDLGTGIDSHDITFSADGKRAYSAAINHTLIMDTSKPEAPVILGRIFDTNSIHHQADPIDVTTALGNRRLLVVTDEVGGGSYGSTCPGGALHVWDVTGDLERTPVKVGVFDAPHIKAAGPVDGKAMGCTSHVLRFYPQQKIMTIAWYNLGVHVVDISNMLGLSVGATPAASTGAAMGMKELGWAWFADSDTWSAKTNKINTDGSFFLYGNDITRGLDIYRYTKAAAGTPAGTVGGAQPTWSFHTPDAFEALKTANLAASGRTSLADLLPLCMRGSLRAHHGNV